MRILRVAQKVYPDVVGGGPYHVHAMSRDQAAMGHEVTVLTVTDDDSLPRRERRDGYTLVRQRPTVKLLGNGISGGVAKFVAQAEDYDVVHAHSHLYFSTNLAALKRHYKGIPLAITNHGLYSQNAPKWVFDAYLRTLGRWTFDSADIVFCYTDEDKARVREFGVDTDIEVIPNGIDQTRFTPDGSESNLVTANGPVVLFVGRFVEGKRPADVVESFAKVQENHPDAELYLCGDGPLLPKLQRQAGELGIIDSVTFLGHVSYDEMPEIYRSSDVLMLPSRAEGLPRTILEAFASGTPVLASNLEQVAPLVEQAGKTAPIGSIGDYTAALNSLLKDSEYREELGHKGRALVNDEYVWEQTVTKTTIQLKQIIYKSNLKR